MPKPADTRLSDAALLAFLVSILTAAILVILVSALLPGMLVFHTRYACDEPILLTADLVPVTNASAPDARLMCLNPGGSYSPYIPSRTVFFSWLVYACGSFLVFFGIFSRKPRRRRKKR